MYKFLLPLCFLAVGCPGGLCGDNSLDTGEACDDGNTSNADGCEADCSLPACQNGIVDPGEVCFFASVEFETDEAPVDIVVADFNGDDHLDLVTANSVGLSLSVLLGDGAGGFTRAPDVDLVQVTFVVAVGDLDGDSVPDLAVSFFEIDRVDVFRGLGDGSFAPLVTFTLIDPTSLVFGDFNSDQRTDLVSASETGVAVFINNGGGNFFDEFFSAVSSVADLAAGDFNGDGDLDLVATHGVAEDAIRVLLGDGFGNFATQAPQPAGAAGDILVEDFNSNNALDLVVGRFSAGEVGVFAGAGLGAFSEVQTIEVVGPAALAAGDLDGDGALDLATTSAIDQQTPALAVSLGDGAGFFALPLLFSAGLSNPSGLVLADFNEDGALDAALADQGFGRVLVFFSEP